MKLIESKTLAIAQASIDFISIPQNYTDLVIKISGRASGSATRDDISITLNGDAGSNYFYRRLIGYDSNQISADANSGTPGQTRAVSMTANTATANTFSNTEIYFPNYTSTTSKSFNIESAAENNSSSSWIMGVFSYRYTTTLPITSISFAPNSNFMAGSTISIYGILKGSDGIVTTS